MKSYFESYGSYEILYRNYLSNSTYNAFNEKTKPNITEDTLLKIYDILKEIFEIKENINSLLEIYNKIKNKEEIDFSTLFHTKSIDIIGNNLKKNLKESTFYINLNNINKILLLLGIDSITFNIKKCFLDSN